MSPWRGTAPVQLVIMFVGAVLLLCVLGMIALASIAVWQGHDVGNAIPQELATVAIASMTAMAGLLAPNTGLLSSSRTARRAEAAGHAAASAVIDAEAQARADRADGEGSL